MNRRQFITLFVGVAVAWPAMPRAQQAAMPVIGMLESGSAAPQELNIAAFRQGLVETGYSEGRNLAIEYRSAEGEYGRLPALAADLVRRQVAVIAATGSQNSAQAAKAATSTIPIVFANGGDPVQLGLVASLGRPDGNATGVSFYLGAVASKRVELLRGLLPDSATIVVLANPNNPTSQAAAKETQVAAQTMGLATLALDAGTPDEIDAAFATMARQRAAGLVINVDVFLYTRREQIAALAARHGIFAMAGSKDYVRAGGLMSYGASVADGYRQAGIYTGKILKGAKPADLPVLLPTKFEFAINLKTAKALGLQVPDKLLALADE
jgi:putative tryptophan/tyrosine transport system substrate-binding protein